MADAVTPDDVDGGEEHQVVEDLPMVGFRHSDRWLYGTMLVSALVGLTAAMVLSVDAVELAAHPTATLSCDLNAVLSCGTVARAWQASLLGFPNAFLGLVAEPVVVTIAVAGLAGVRFPRWFMLSAQLVYLCGLVLAYWLFSQSLLVIGALCPWCMLVTVSTTFVFMTFLHVNVRDANLYLPARVQRAAAAGLRTDLDVAVTAGLLATIALLVVIEHGAAIFGG